MIAVGKLVSYSVSQGSTTETTAIYKVMKVSTNTDPLGCGLTGKVTYIIVMPLDDTPGTQQQAIRVIFYGGSAAPNIKEIDDDPAVCAVHSFGKLTKK